MSVRVVPLQLRLNSTDLFGPQLLLDLLRPQCGLHARPSFCVNYVIPVLLGPCWEFFPSLHQEDAGVTDVTATHLNQPEAALEVHLVAFAVGEAGAGGLGSADAAAVDAPVHLRLVEVEHLDFTRQPERLTLVSCAENNPVVLKKTVSHSTMPEQTFS